MDVVKEKLNSFINKNKSLLIFIMVFSISYNGVLPNGEQMRVPKTIFNTLIIISFLFMLFIVEKKNASKIVDLFNSFEEHLGIVDFKVLFPCILTDKDPSFSDFLNIEFSCVTGEERTHVFYCDAIKSNQKANVENMNKQLRKYFPKGKSIDSYTGEDINNAMNFINNLRAPSLSGYTPNEAFEKVYGKELLDKVKTFIYK